MTHESLVIMEWGLWQKHHIPHAVLMQTSMPSDGQNESVIGQQSRRNQEHHHLAADDLAQSSFTGAKY